MFINNMTIFLYTVRFCVSKGKIGGALQSDFKILKSWNLQIPSQVAQKEMKGRNITL